MSRLRVGATQDLLRIEILELRACSEIAQPPLVLVRRTVACVPVAGEVQHRHNNDPHQIHHPKRKSIVGVALGVEVGLEQPTVEALGALAAKALFDPTRPRAL